MLSLLPFFAVSLLAAAAPGPAVLYVVSAGVSDGPKGFAPGAMGILLADAFYYALSVGGLGTFMLANYRLFATIKTAGAVYLMYLGLKLLWLAYKGSDDAPLAMREATASGWLGGGFATHAANPKALLYFGAIVPQFMRPDRAFLPQVLALGLIHLSMASLVLFSYGCFASRIKSRLLHPRCAKALRAVSGTMLVTAGASLAVVKRTK